MEETPWPSWLSAIWPTWLEQTGYPANGVGDLDDLKFIPSVANNGKWIGYVNTGWYYHDNSEQYNYVLVGSIAVTGVTGSGSVSTTSFRPAWGPVLISETTSGEPYRQHHNSFYPGLTLTWSLVNSGVYSAALPSSSLLVGMRNLTNLPLGSVAGTGLLISDKLFYYDMTNNLVYVKPKTSTISIWADIVYTVPRLRFREIVTQTPSGLLPSYTGIRDINVIRGTDTYSASAYHASGYVTHTLSGNTGDWFILDYWVDKSFILDSHSTLKYYSTLASSNITIYHETSLPDTFQPIQITSGSTGILNLNPTFSDSFRSGYLFHATPASAIENYWEPSDLTLYLDKDNVCSEWEELLLLRLSLTEENGLPIPNYQFTLTTSGCTVYATYPSGYTNNSGESFYYLQPVVGATSINVTAIVGSLTSIVSASITASGSMVTISKWIDGFSHLLITKDKSGDGAFRLFSNLTNLDGCPRAGPMTLRSELASEFRDGNSLFTNTLQVNHSQDGNNICSINEIGYIPQPNDRLFGMGNTGQSKIERAE